ncbi:hypothetical protein AYO21_09999 [Fonsecaea monophora]|uniref:N-acetyltransferase domain-containing protein n=1 Tax=Fonsecaea monophora TaxID=254056 RepID=A0A177EXS8_9EURO|nr:hypothetical protein AYO21_09999 [Fonsecaea monophora]OAG35842.1 hypothetical protein AYO21_09999 [Fonsecaea monophora]
MPIRPATISDIPAMAEIYAAAFSSNLMFQFLFPYIKEHPEAFVQAARENLTVAWYDFSQIFVVSYEAGKVDNGQLQDARSALLSSGAPEHAGSETVTGFAQWQRVGTGWEHVHGIWGRWDPRLMIMPAVSKFYSIRRYIWPNKAAARPTEKDPDPLTIWNFLPRIRPLCLDFFSAPHRQIHWSLEFLAIHPNHQGKGFGRELVEDGLVKAEKDPAGDLPVSVVAAEGKEYFYLKVGFNELLGYTSQVVGKDGSENPLKNNNIGGGAMLWTK